MRRIIIGSFAAIVLLILFVVLFTFVRRPYEKVLIDRFGTLVPQERQTRIMYNWYFKLPTDTLVRIDTRLHLKTLPLQEFVTANSEPVNVRPFVIWRIVDPMLFRQKANGSDQQAEDFIEVRIRGLVGQALGVHKLDEFFNPDPATEQHTRDLEKKIADEATKGNKASADGKYPETPGLEKIGIEVADVGFSRIAFPPDNTTAVYQRMVAALNEKARGFEAEGVKQADILRAEGLVKAADIRKTAQAEAQRIMGEGDSEALRILSVVNQTDAAREFYQYWKSLDFLKTTLTKNNYLVLSTDNDWLRSLFTRPQGIPFTAIPVPTTLPASRPGPANALPGPLLLPENVSATAPRR